MNCTFVLSSVTYAMKASKLLAYEGIPSSPVKTTEVRKVRGCGYGISVRSGCERAKAILAGNGIKILGVIGDKE